LLAVTYLASRASTRPIADLAREIAEAGFRIEKRSGATGTPLRWSRLFF